MESQLNSPGADEFLEKERQRNPYLGVPRHPPSSKNSRLRTEFGDKDKKDRGAQDKDDTENEPSGFLDVRNHRK